MLKKIVQFLLDINSDRVYEVWQLSSRTRHRMLDRSETSVWFDDLGISAFHSCVFVDLSLFLSGVYYCLCVFWCIIARMSELIF